jgi:hypothetical protein
MKWLGRAALVVAGLLFGASCMEVGMRLAGLPRSGPFLQEFRGERFKLMSYDTNPSGALDLDLSDPTLRALLAERLFDRHEFERA